MSEPWRIEPEPSEEELAALTVAVVGAATVQMDVEPEPPPVSAWSRAARREALEARTGAGVHWSDRS